jgi:hypothetical protein
MDLGSTNALIEYIPECSIELATTRALQSTHSHGSQHISSKDGHAVSDASFCGEPQPRFTESPQISVGSNSIPVSSDSDISTQCEELPRPGTSIQDEGTRTTVNLGGIPCRYTQSEVLDEVRSFGYEFDLLYLPHAVRSPGNLGYAFINFCHPCDAQKFIHDIEGYKFRKQHRSKKVAHAVFAKIQGITKNLSHFCVRETRYHQKKSVRKYRPWIHPDVFRTYEDFIEKEKLSHYKP